MVNSLRRSLVVGLPAALALRPFAAAAQAPLRIEITEGVIEPMPFAAPGFVPDSAEAADLAARITQVVIDDLTGTGLFREIPSNAHIGRITNFDAPVQFADWKAINAQALITGAAGQRGDRVSVRFRLWDVFAQTQLGEGLQFEGTAQAWRRMGHKVADAVYSRLTGEGGYFDSRVAYIAASGPKSARRKQIAVMDYDGANPVMLTDGNALVLTPRISRSASQILYTSYEQGAPRVLMIEAGGGRRQVLDDAQGMTFAPRFSPDASRAVYSASTGTGSDIFVVDLASRRRAQLTQTSSIDTAPAFSNDGGQIVFESDRAGTQQLYVMSAGGGEARRISFGEGRYATPVWSPRGDMIAFTKIVGGRFHVGVMRTDGSNEKLLTASYIDEGPTWAPNGRVLMFFRETPGDTGGPQIYSVDITGRNLRKVPTAGFASDPSWSGLLG
ncbi:MAG TPA: Tol-Pal system beta propeller repeat protein TolB [Amaricoccus sp.]|uniref:Tol-Pal system beta propeller repeat protein TolB n=1 Tax=Amaricoccus sp. TaxID=1872485 RepID=UPI002CC250A1|nr:Tol-Pal system beta propeller repeat protein TolB [Amaricoccus sp.]HMQ95517.1 Tol-Pal system beta propeller repeat protein TolB [Amaricoccus sp.]HMR51324.1 Tol-Pal system beta propeller repeat protein TolB [Amaricoccus sp.]HMR62346.1 Tol-Pal system beta propeller repeat protein TolB [Amaricoccus sp.]HMT98232.1 Tol-Pal system beta propeller repeat protein TolB [Amaricoccus sp.]